MRKNKIKKSSFFVSGARPFILWILGLSLAWQFLIAPILASILSIFGIYIWIPYLEIENVFAILAGMLGLGGLRTYEKKKGISNN